MVNAFQPQQTGINAFVPSAQTVQMLAGGQSASPWSSMNQMLVGQRQQQAERAAFEQSKSEKAALSAKEQSRYDSKIQAAKDAVKYQKELDSAMLATPKERYKDGKRELWFESKAGKGEWRDAGGLTPSQQASLDKAKGGGQHKPDSAWANTVRKTVSEKYNVDFIDGPDGEKVPVFKTPEDKKTAYLEMADQWAKEFPDARTNPFGLTTEEVNQAYLQSMQNLNGLVQPEPANYVQPVGMAQPSQVQSLVERYRSK